MTSRREKPWHKNASNSLVAHSILAAVSAIVAQIIITFEPATGTRWVFLVLAVAAILLFILSVEKITEAITDDNVRTYVAYSVPYNLAVLLLFIGLWHCVRRFADFSLGGSAAAAVTFLLVWVWGWGSDTWLLIRKDDAAFQAYLDELEGNCEPKTEPDWFTRLFFRLRSWFRAEER